MNTRPILEQALKELDPSFLTQYENVKFEPTGVPYQQVFVINSVINEEYGSNYQVKGILHINLIYPINNGTRQTDLKAREIQTYFKRGSSFRDEEVTITITDTPDINPGYRQVSDWVTPIRIKWYAQFK